MTARVGSNDVYDIAVVGAGFYGSRTALLLADKGLRVLLIDACSTPCASASRFNQSRIHNGYHYPRSLMTALGSHKNYHRFKQDFSPHVLKDFVHLYAMAVERTHVTASQFRTFCKTLSLPLKQPRRDIRALFSRTSVEEVFVVEESSLDTGSLSIALSHQIAVHPRIAFLPNTVCARFSISSGCVDIHATNGIHHARHVLNIAYAGCTRLLINSGFSPISLKAEITELPVIKPSPELSGLAITLMDGPFFSCVPSNQQGICTFSHVRYTPHAVIPELCAENAYQVCDGYRIGATSRFSFMRNDAARYVPCMRQATYVGSQWQAKVVPLKNEADDGRPILFDATYGKLGESGPSISTVLGSKLDSVYEWEDVLQARF